jgi:hypothetical protein
MSVVLFPTSIRTYEGTVQDVLGRARYLLQDEGKETPTSPLDPTLYRWTDAELLVWVNDGLDAAARVNPALFTKPMVHNCTAGYYQTLSIARAVRLVDVVGVQICDKEALTQFAPGWQSGTPGTARNWMPAPGDENSFMVYPPSPSEQSLTVMVVQAHPRVDDGADVIDLPETHIPALAQFVVGMAESKDDEQINTQRQQAVMANFAALIKGS